MAAPVEQDTVSDKKQQLVCTENSNLNETKETDMTGESSGCGGPCFCVNTPEACHWYCETCRHPICHDCALGKHVYHGCKQLSEVAQTIREEAMGLIRMSQEATSELKGAVQSKEDLIQDVEALKLNAYSSIQKAFDELRTAMERRRGELLAQVEDITADKMTALVSRKNELETLRSEMKECCEVASNTMDTHQQEEVAPLWDLLAAEMQSVQDRLEALPPFNPVATAVAVDPTRVVENISKFGTIDYN